MDNSPLNDLPAELRNRIYEYALHENGSVAISPNFITEPGLLRTCKQVRAEAELLFYAVNRFTAICWFGRDDRIKHLVCFLERKQGKRLALMRRLTIRIEAPGSVLRDGLIKVHSSADGGITETSLATYLPEMLSTFDLQTRQWGTLFYFRFNSMSDETPLEVVSSSNLYGKVSMQQFFCWELAINLAFFDEIKKHIEAQQAGQGPMLSGEPYLQRLQKMRKKAEVEAEGTDGSSDPEKQFEHPYKGSSL